jgi:predicted RNA-binding protein associated with RNAse of E/G family
MSQSGRWQEGNVVVYREVFRGAIWTARPTLVVRDTPALVALYLPNYTCWKLPAGARMAYFDYLKAGEWKLADAEWQYGDTLFLARPGAAHSIHVMWAPGNRSFVGWYVNLQEPLRRTPVGFDFMDHEIDIVVHPDLSWAWKDEDHLDRAATDNRYSAAEIVGIREEGERVTQLITSGASPFSDGWESWQPPPGWTAPELPAGWDIL